MQKYANLVEFEKCCQTHIFLQKFVLIQPRTSPPKICKILLIFPILLTLTLAGHLVAHAGVDGLRGGEAGERPDFRRAAVEAAAPRESGAILMDSIHRIQEYFDKIYDFFRNVKSLAP